MTEIEKRILEYYKQDTIMCAYLKHTVFNQDVEITFNNKTEYFSKEKLMDLTKDIEYNWDEDNCLWSEEVNFKNFTPSNWYVQICITRHLNNWAQNNE